MIPFFLVIAAGWKILKRPLLQRLATMDLVGETPLIDAYEDRLVELEDEATRIRVDAALEVGTRRGMQGALRPIQAAWAKLALWFA